MSCNSPRRRRHAHRDCCRVLKLAPTSTSFDQLAKAYLDDYELQRFRSLVTAKQRVAHLREHFGKDDASTISPDRIRQYQLQGRQAGAAAATVNRERSALKRMFQLANRYGVFAHIPVSPTRLRENPPRPGFFEHEEYLKVRAQLTSPYQDVLDFAYLLRLATQRDMAIDLG